MFQKIMLMFEIYFKYQSSIDFPLHQSKAFSRIFARSSNSLYSRNKRSKSDGNQSMHIVTFNHIFKQSAMIFWNISISQNGRIKLEFKSNRKSLLNVSTD